MAADKTETSKLDIQVEAKAKAEVEASLAVPQWVIDACDEWQADGYLIDDEIEARLAGRETRLAGYYSEAQAGLPTHPANITSCQLATAAEPEPDAEVETGRFISHAWKERKSKDEFRMVCSECGSESVIAGTGRDFSQQHSRGQATGRGSHEDKDDDAEERLPQTAEERSEVLANVKAHRLEVEEAKRQKLAAEQKGE